MKENKFYKIAFILMFLLNIVVLGYLYVSKTANDHPERDHPKRPSNFEHARKTMNLNEAQLVQFKELVMKHQGQMRNINERQRNILSPLFKNTDVKTESSNIKKLGELEQEKVQLTLNHFDDIKKILNEEQFSGFDSFKETVSTALLSPRKPLPRHKHKGHRHK